jgi:hypothetical protein
MCGRPTGSLLLGGAMVARLRLAVAMACLVGLSASCSTSSTSATDQSPDCREVEAFATQLVDVAIDFDYEPSTGPAELAGRVDVVLRGQLTGNSTVQGEYLGYELGDVQILTGDPPSEAGETAMVTVMFNPAYRPARSHQDAIVAGAPIIAFAHRWEGLPGGLIAGLPEGFMTACDGEPPIGWAVDYDGWGTMASLDDVAEAVETTP